MKKNIIITVVLTLASIDYLIKGFTAASIACAVVSVIPMIASSKHILLDKSIVVASTSLIAFLSIIIYFSKLYVILNHISIPVLMLALNSGLLINILNHTTEEKYDEANEIFRVLTFVFMIFLFASLLIPNVLIENYFYLEGKLTLISLLLVIFGPYLFMNELSGVLRLIK